MKTRCPNCQTTFRVTPDQLKARAGNVRCGQCDSAFNALDSLVVGSAVATHTAATASAANPPVVPPPLSAATWTPTTDAAPTNDISQTAASHDSAPELSVPGLASTAVAPLAPDTIADPASDEADAIPPDAIDAADRLSEADAHELGKVTGLILPRETSDIPGYSRWSEGGVVSDLSLAPPETAMRWPFVIAALLLGLALATQLVFHFRSDIVVAFPSLRPAILTLSQAVEAGADIPLPRDVDRVSIEASDLQTDAARGNLLVLNATLRNRAIYEQAYPSLELSLTDTQDIVIARRVFLPAEYLPATTPPGQPFAARSELPLRLWIAAQDIAAAGYRLYVFYP